MSKFLINNACCYDGGNEDPEVKDCLDKWKIQLEEVCNQYSISSAITEKNKEEYTNSSNWQLKLKNWCDSIATSDEKAKTIVKELEFILEQTAIVCDSSRCSAESIQKLLGLVKSIFDCLFTYEQNKKGLKEQIQDFKKAIECLTSVSDEDKAEVLKCLETYELKIALVCEMQEKVLTQLLEILKLANLLANYIGGESGLKTKLETMLAIFSGSKFDDCTLPNNGEDFPAAEKKAPKIDIKEYDGDYPCNENAPRRERFALHPKFPISNSHYYIDIKNRLEIATAKTKELEQKWVTSKKQSDTILSKKESLQEAIKAAEAAGKA